MNSISLRQLKQDFREWCSALTIKEIVSNKELIKTIERIERMFESEDLCKGETNVPHRI